MQTYLFVINSTHAELININYRDFQSIKLNLNFKLSFSNSLKFSLKDTLEPKTVLNCME